MQKTATFDKTKSSDTTSIRIKSLALNGIIIYREWLFHDAPSTSKYSTKVTRNALHTLVQHSVKYEHEVNTFAQSTDIDGAAKTRAASTLQNIEVTSLFCCFVLIDDDDSNGSESTATKWFWNCADLKVSKLVVLNEDKY